MKSLWIFIGGFFSGILFLVLVALAVNYSSRNDNGENGIVLFDEPGEILSTQPFEVFQVLDHGAALAREIDKSYASWNATTELMVLLINDEGKYYYDDQIIEIPKGKCLRQVGVYKYMTKAEFEKTVPIAKIMDK
ncbi:hypothetical protein [uncultured Alistipes sp.]|uniref:hypothetical protein n=1 Tax=uncultured Alistipes sp. TaxID=538949 RepID=UPI0026292156|nr:hypothetical protein [uncultured Alistipes sp.]